jgi:hypothetical protein
MGWFLTKNKKKERRAPKQARSSQPQQKWDPQRTLKGLKILGLGVLTFGVLATWRYAETRIGQYLIKRGPIQVLPQQIELADAPGWMSPVLAEHLRWIVAGQVSSNPMDQQSLNVAAAALNRNPWVESVGRVERFGDGSIRVHAKYREPVAVVMGPKGFYPVDGQGVRLPGVYQTHQLSLVGLPVIIGVAEVPAGEGERWPGDDLEAGLSLVRWLEGEPYADQIAAFDVSDRDARGRVRLVLRTDQGMVRWGLPPGMERSIEPNAETKKRWLRSVHRQRGRIDAGGKVVDVFGAAVFVHQPYVSEQTTLEQARYSWSR